MLHFPLLSLLIHSYKLEIHGTSEMSRNSLNFYPFLLSMHYGFLRKWEIGIFPPQSPFSPGMIISENLFGDCPPSSDIYLGTSWTQSTEEELSTIDPVSIQAGCRKEANQIYGRVEP